MDLLRKETIEEDLRFRCSQELRRALGDPGFDCGD
jgi:hypothetical protein